MAAHVTCAVFLHWQFDLRVHKTHFSPRCRGLDQQEVAVTTNGEKQDFLDEKAELILMKREEIDC